MVSFPAVSPCDAERRVPGGPSDTQTFSALLQQSAKRESTTKPDARSARAKPGPPSAAEGAAAEGWWADKMGRAHPPTFFPHRGKKNPDKGRGAWGQSPRNKKSWWADKMGRAHPPTFFPHRGKKNPDKGRGVWGQSPRNKKVRPPGLEPGTQRLKACCSVICLIMRSKIAGKRDADLGE